jgi:signal transduction histidine kinase
MSEFSKYNSIKKNGLDDKGIQELHSLNENFKEMTLKVGNALEKEKQLNHELKEIDGKKTEFMSMISHELKTPLMPIKGYVQLLKKQDLMGSLSEKQLDAINEISISAGKLEKLIQDVLMAQKIDLGKLSVEKDIIESKILVDDSYKAFVPTCEEKGVKLTKSVQSNEVVYSDSDRIAEVFSNLICNALAFLPDKNGAMEIGSKDNSDFVTFYVQDNGAGMSEDQQKNIFKKFYQVDTSSKRKKEGSGLGLAICEGIVKALGGKMWVESYLGKGTTFFFDLPKAKIPVEHFRSMKTKTVKK